MSGIVISSRIGSSGYFDKIICPMANCILDLQAALLFIGQAPFRKSQLIFFAGLFTDITCMAWPSFLLEKAKKSIAFGLS